MSIFSTQVFQKGDIIIHEGHSGDNAYIINKGSVEVFKKTPDNEPVTLAILGAGQIFGEMCLFDNAPRSASVVAMTEVELNIIEKEDFLANLKDAPIQVKIIMELLLTRLRQTSDLVAILKYENTLYKDQTLSSNNSSSKELDQHS